jgi:para-nitrobenzyl esterase
VLTVAADGGRPPAELAQELYRSRPRGRTSPGEAWVAFQSDRVFLMPALRLAELWCRRTPATYSYLFTWSPPLLGRALGSCHGLELPFVFGTLRDALLRPVIGATRAALALSLHMQDAWIAFAREGEPGHDALPAWRAYEPEKRTSMVLGPECVTEGALFEEERRFWETRL